MNKLHCKICRQLKVRNVKQVVDHTGALVVEYYPGSKNKKFIDEEGKLWSGKACPECHRTRTKEHLKSKRLQEKLQEAESDDDTAT